MYSKHSSVEQSKSNCIYLCLDIWNCISFSDSTVTCGNPVKYDGFKSNSMLTTLEGMAQTNTYVRVTYLHTLAQTISDMKFFFYSDTFTDGCFY